VRPGVRPVSDDLSHIYDLVARRLLRGKVVPVLGAGVNLCKPPAGVHFQHGRSLPSGRQLTKRLAEYIGYPMSDDLDLARVSQYVSALEGEGALYEELHNIFDADYPPTLVHPFLARLSRLTRESKDAQTGMLLVTTNYDDVLELAFQEMGEPYDLVTYIAEGRDRGLFRHFPAEGGQVVVKTPNKYFDVRFNRQSVIAKIHGAVDRVNSGDSYVITEDHYIDYISMRADVGGLFPVKLAEKIRTSHLLFLGYSLRDWNLRVMLYRLWAEQEGMRFKSWAVQADPDRIDKAAWDARGVEILPVGLEDFVTAIEQRLDAYEGRA
jgi:hypothetical protein